MTGRKLFLAMGQKRQMQRMEVPMGEENKVGELILWQFRVIWTRIMRGEETVRLFWEKTKSSC